MLQHIKNIFNLGVKELRGLLLDGLLMALIVYAFTLSVYDAASAFPDSVIDAAIAVIDEDHSHLSMRITDAFQQPTFRAPVEIQGYEMFPALDDGIYTFTVSYPHHFERDVMNNKSPVIQVNVDATRVSQAFVGSGYISTIISNEVDKFVKDSKAPADQTSVSLPEMINRVKYNPNCYGPWFDAIAQFVNTMTMLSIILTGSALIRERESGTLEHLMVLPVTTLEIMISKIWSMMFVVFVAAVGCVHFVIKLWLDIPLTGNIFLYYLGILLFLFAMNSLGIFLACVASNMPQLGMFLVLVVLPMQMLSGGATPFESMPPVIQVAAAFLPTSHIISFSRAILFRDAGFSVVWISFLKLFGLGAVFFLYSLARFRKSVAS